MQFSGILSMCKTPEWTPCIKKKKKRNNNNLIKQNDVGIKVTAYIKFQE